MSRTPYEPGDQVLVETADGPVDATVSVVVETTSVDPRRRWRVLCRRPDGRPMSTPFHCGEDGSGRLLQPGAVASQEPYAHS